jgi:hypothetical protein
METWSMYTAEAGNELCAGLQLPEHKARAAAQRRANELGEAVELVQAGKRKGEVFEPEAAADLVILEIMPDHLRATHAEAGNAGVYPHNGAVRYLANRVDAESVVESAGDWARIVRDAKPGDVGRFDEYRAG